MVAISLLVAATLLSLASSQEIFSVSSKEVSSAPTFSTEPCSGNSTRLHLPDGPQDNYFYSDCHTAVHVIITSPQADSNLSVIKPRLIIAWPAGNSGAMALFTPENGQDGTLSISLINSTGTDSSGNDLTPVNEEDRVGVSGYISFNDSARLSMSILGSVRAIRDFTEGGGKTSAEFQNGLMTEDGEGVSKVVSRVWLDNVTETRVEFVPLDGEVITTNSDANKTLTFPPGTYKFTATYNYPQLTQLDTIDVLNPSSASLITQNPDLTTSLSFLSYDTKLLAGTWRFLTYFGRDTLISLLLMQPILSDAAIEAVLGAVMERVNRTDGTVCHEEVLGDYATFVNGQDGIVSSRPSCDYKMVDTDFMLPVAMVAYFEDTSSGKNRSDAFFARNASFLEENSGLSYIQLATFTAEKIMRIAEPFAGDPLKENLISLLPDQPVGEWRDSNNGLGGGRTPFDVNTALVPAALRAIGVLSRAGYFPAHGEWGSVADEYAQIWEDSTLSFFTLTVPYSTALSQAQTYASSLSIPFNTSSITADITYHGIALDGWASQPIVPILHTDTAFRHFFLNSTNDTQLSQLLDETADSILRPFPTGLSTDVGLVVANPVFAGNEAIQANFTTRDYHGTVVWSWQLAMMGKGLARQLDRCEASSTSTSSASTSTSSTSQPAFCSDSALYTKVQSAYEHLWDLIEANEQQLSHEVWSWKYESGKYEVVQLGEVTSTESNIRQLWSLVFLAVGREEF